MTPHSRLVWTNEESDDGAVTTVTFEEKGGKTLLVMHELYPSKEALDAAIAGMEGGMPETFAQLDELLVTLGASVERSEVAVPGPLARNFNRTIRLEALRSKMAIAAGPFRNFDQRLRRLRDLVSVSFPDVRDGHALANCPGRPDQLHARHGQDLRALRDTDFGDALGDQFSGLRPRHQDCFGFQLVGDFRVDR